MGTTEATDQPQNHRVELLRSTPAFAEMDAGVLRALMAAGQSRALAREETLFSAGEAFHRAVYVLLEGKVEIRRESGRTESPPPGYFLGLSSYLADSPYASTAVALTDANVLEVPAAELQRLERAYPALFDALNRLIANGLRQRRASHRGVSGALARPVGEIMHAPLATCPPDLTLTEALQTMLDRKIGSLAVIDEENRLAGVVTFRTVAARLVEKGGAAADTLTVSEGCRKPVTVPPTVPIWQAESIQEQESIKYLVVAEGDRPVGMVSQSDIVRALASHQDTLAATIANTDTLDDLAAIVADMAAVATEALNNNRHASNAVRSLSEGHLAVQRRCLELTLDELKAEGLGGPPAPYAFIIMGSGGRKEMLLNPDQDNGLILADEPDTDAEATQTWSQSFAERANQNLDRVGYILCPGEIMARKPMYH
ncbi:MAG: cyclic nucleotide-binding protein, partial [Gammaproteobacteria bacterium]